MNELDRLLSDEEYRYRQQLKRRLLIEDYERSLFNYFKEGKMNYENLYQRVINTTGKEPMIFTKEYDSIWLKSVPKTLPEIKQVIFNPPATIVIWKDDTKTIVKTHNEEFDEEKGFAMAYLKKVFGDRNKYMKYVKDAKRQLHKEIHKTEEYKNEKEFAGYDSYNNKLYVGDTVVVKGYEDEESLVCTGGFEEKYWIMGWAWLGLEGLKKEHEIKRVNK